MELVKKLHHLDTVSPNGKWSFEVEITNSGCVYVCITDQKGDNMARYHLSVVPNHMVWDCELPKYVQKLAHDMRDQYMDAFKAEETGEAGEAEEWYDELIYFGNAFKAEETGEAGEAGEAEKAEKAGETTHLEAEKAEKAEKAEEIYDLCEESEETEEICDLCEVSPCDCFLQFEESEESEETEEIPFALTCLDEVDIRLDIEYWQMEYMYCINNGYTKHADLCIRKLEHLYDKLQIRGYYKPPCIPAI